MSYYEENKFYHSQNQRSLLFLDNSTNNSCKQIFSVLFFLVTVFVNANQSGFIFVFASFVFFFSSSIGCDQSDNHRINNTFTPIPPKILASLLYPLVSLHVFGFFLLTLFWYGMETYNFLLFFLLFGYTLHYWSLFLCCTWKSLCI